MSHRTTASAEARRLLALPGAVILDSETTDLRGYFCQIAVLALNGTPLLDTLVNPCEPISTSARRIHGISDNQVASAPTFAQVEPQMRAQLHGKDVIVYNVSFDRGILESELARLFRSAEGGSLAQRRLLGYQAAATWLKDVRWHCAMTVYAEWVGEYRRGSYKWQPLPGGDHSAAGDCKAVLAVLKRMAESE